MRSTFSTAAILAIFANTITASVTLGDFYPYLTDLQGSCETIYTTQIVRCSQSDFSGSGCSSNCIAGLTALTPAVQSACGNAGITGNNVVASFLAGTGVHGLCPNAPAPSTTQQQTTSQQETTAPAPSTSETPSTMSTQQPSTSSAAPSTSATSATLIPADTSSSSTSSSTAGTSSLTSSSGTSASASAPVSGSSSGSTSSAQTTSAYLFAPTSTDSSSQTAASTQSSASASQTLHPNSGGGSPFDTPGVPSSAAPISSCPLVILASALLAVLALIS